MSAGGGRAEDRAGRQPGDAAAGSERESIAEVLASIRALVSEESRARQAPSGQELATVLVLTPDMQSPGVPATGAPSRSGEILAEGLAPRPPRAQPAPILDEEALRGVINALVREELQGELGDRISRNLRKLIRRELAQMLQEQAQADEKAADT